MPVVQRTWAEVAKNGKVKRPPPPAEELDDEDDN
jgi:hypothetical protein